MASHARSAQLGAWLTCGVIAVACAACTSGSPRANLRTAPVTESAAHSSVTVSSPPGHPKPAASIRHRLRGKFNVGPIVFNTDRVGDVFVGGFVGQSDRISSWQERTIDGGQHWTAGAVAHSGAGRSPVPRASTQINAVAVSRSTGWDYQPSLFFTTDAGVHWQRVHNLPGMIGPAADVGGSTWFVVTCRSGACTDRLYRASRVGAPLHPLPGQPVSRGHIGSLVRLTRSAAWVLSEDRGRERLSRTDDGGRTWRHEQLPCHGAQSVAVTGSASTAALLVCTYPFPNMCSTCTPVVLYRPSASGTGWVRVTPGRSVPRYGPTTPNAFVTPVSAHTIWAVNQIQTGSGTVLRSTDGGRTWQHVRTSRKARPLDIRSFAAASPSRAWFATVTLEQSGDNRFDVHRTFDGGKSWQVAALPVPTALH